MAKGKSRGPALTLLAAALACAQGPEGLYNKSLEDLMATEVTSAGKKEQRLSQAPAAIHVITAEEIRRSGATNIPDLLRMVPGMNVAQINSHTWAISARGMPDQFANKMLVLIDGRAVYDPLFSGVIWSLQDLPLEDIDRIEVIRGPGATMWGTNAVNGVINVITKPADQTQGALISAGAGTVDRAHGLVRYGGAAGQRGYYRVYAKYFDRGNRFDRDPALLEDDQRMVHGGFRTDWNLSQTEKLTLQGDWFGSKANSAADLFSRSLLPLERLVPLRADLGGGNLLGRWTHTLRNGSETTLQVYYERSVQDYSVLSMNRHSLDFDFQHHLGFGERHDVVWGLGYRTVRDSARQRLNISLTPAARFLNTMNSFLQDEIELVRGRSWLTLGAKFERNSYSGLQAQPSAKILWTPGPRSAVWGAVSVADRTPSRTDSEVDLRLATVGFQNGIPLVARLYGNPKLRSEHLLAYESGYRSDISRRLTLDLALFYNRYDRLRTIEPGEPFLEQTPSAVELVLPQTFANLAYGASYGAEVQAIWIMFRWSTLNGGYTRYNPAFHLRPSSRNTTAVAGLEDITPRNQFSLRSSVNLPHRFELDQALYFTGRLAAGPTPAHLRYDVRCGWRAGESTEFSIVGQNLLGAHHIELFGAGDLSVPAAVKRSVHGRLTWRF